MAVQSTPQYQHHFIFVGASKGLSAHHLPATDFSGAIPKLHRFCSKSNAFARSSRPDAGTPFAAQSPKTLLLSPPTQH
jgi:hypothetical protein